MSHHLALVPHHSEKESVDQTRVPPISAQPKCSFPRFSGRLSALKQCRMDRQRRVQFRKANVFAEHDGERGAVTAEYAIVILAAVAFAGLLVLIMRSEEVRGMLTQMIQNALGSAE